MGNSESGEEEREIHGRNLGEKLSFHLENGRKERVLILRGV
jgi:hypothetical protein